MTPGSIETTTGTVSHKRYNTITMRNEDALRPGVMKTTLMSNEYRHGTAPDMSSIDNESCSVQKYHMERDAGF